MSQSREAIVNHPEAIGAVLVVGGGIAGMQAALTLAECGYRVYLVESRSAIGGHMAQLDKTFPTNDCAMCTISPKLVETGRHLNIEVLTNSDVIGVKGVAGNFTVSVRTRPRYVDTRKCTGCGECADVCPVLIPDLFNEGLSARRAAYRLYPQAFPTAYAIEKRGIAPCRDACPAHQRAQGYIALIREGRFADALRVIKEDNPFPGICGRICNHRCEDACNRGKVDDPINIHALKRFVTDVVYAQPRVPPEPAARRYSERVAIIGAGPCGLTAAQDLCKLGYPVTVFESLPVAGGMLRVGVPEYRLPSWIVDREVQDILDLGVELRLNTTVTNLDDLFREGFQAILIAVGAHEGIRLPIPGNDLEGVLINTQFLRDVRLATLSGGNPGGNPARLPEVQGKRVLVLGGGNVAIDVARTALRLGAREVHMACLEARDAMPAHPWEVEAALAEGIIIHNERTFLRILDDGRGRVAGVECQRVAHFEFDEQGRLSVEAVAGSEHVLPAEVVIFSVGQRAGLAFVPEDAGVGLTPRRTIAINPNTYATSRPGVFAAGDSVSGTSFVIEAVASGHDCAQVIHRYLRGEPLEPKPRPDLPVVKLGEAELRERMRRGEIHITHRVPMPELPVTTRRSTFAEVELGYTPEQAQAEAARCLACGICSECLSCVYQCGVGAIDHDMPEHVGELKVGAIILAPGFMSFPAEVAEEYGWGRYPNVVTSLQFERLLSASGPTSGHVRRPSDGQRPRRIAFLQCIGSRDQQHDYCSAVCCMYATKEAIMAIEHARDTSVHIFMMDMRAAGKGYEEYYRRARERYGVRYTRCRVSSVKEDPATHNLIVRYVEVETNTLREEEFDLVVLSVGMSVASDMRQLARNLGVKLDQHGFCRTLPFEPLQTNRPGIYVAGAFREPKDIPQSVTDGNGAAGRAGILLAAARGTLVRQPEYPPERDVTGEEPRVAVFVCHCGKNIGGFLDVPQVAAYAATLPYVIHAEHNLYTCSQDSIAHITEKVKELGANRVVVASCTPLTHQPLFQSSIRAAGLNPYLCEMANIRNQCSWVHSDAWETATQKAKDLVRMAVGRAVHLEPLHTVTMPVEKAALVVGGGAAGMTAALSLARQGFPVHLVERNDELGGHLRHLYYSLEMLLSPDARADPPGAPHANPQEFLRSLMRDVQAHPLIRVHLQTEVLETQGVVGRFTSILQTREGEQLQVHHGVTILATGGVEYRGPEYLYGQHPRVISQQEFETLLAAVEGIAETDRAHRAELPDHVLMILCVGPAEEYCSRICCNTALKNALVLKRLKPGAEVTILYRDIRACGFKEKLYTRARQAGVRFIHYDFDRKPEVMGEGDRLRVAVWEVALGQSLQFTPDLLVLSNPVVPAEGVRALSKRLKVPLDGNGFFMEAHVKLRPVEFSSDGFFMAGTASYPKSLDETIVEALAASARAATVLAQDSIQVGGSVAVVDASRCVACLTCVRTCPYHAPRIVPDLIGVGGIRGAAQIEAAACHGCGSCVVACPARAIQLAHYTDSQMQAKVDALFGNVVSGARITPWQGDTIYSGERGTIG
jgi:heterodisulfide reductase subunit A-like polyferredoxin